MALGEGIALDDVTGALGPVFSLRIGRAERWRWGGPRAWLARAPSVGEWNGVVLDLTGARAEIVSGAAVEVTAETADLALEAWVKGDEHAKGAIPLDGNACNEVSQWKLVPMKNIEENMLTEVLCHSMYDVGNKVLGTDNNELGHSAKSFKENTTVSQILKWSNPYHYKDINDRQITE